MPFAVADWTCSLPVEREDNMRLSCDATVFGALALISGLTAGEGSGGCSNALHE